MEQSRAFHLLGCLLLIAIFVTRASAQYFDTADVDTDEDDENDMVRTTEFNNPI